MNERTKELAEQAGMHYRESCDEFCAADTDGVPLAMMTIFADYVRYDETKACAKHYLEIMRDAVEQARADERDKCAQDYLQDCADAVEEARRNERYIKEMEQPTPKQSGVMSITVSKVCEADALPPTTNAIYWMDMVVANLVRNGVNKHRAKELAYHFYTYTTPRENNNG